MKQYRGGAVATTAKGDNPKRDAVATGDSLFNTYSARPVLPPSAYKGYRQLVVKDNSNKNDDVDILRVANYLCKLMNFRMTNHYYFENGKQSRRHIHCLVRAPKLYNLQLATDLFKSKVSLPVEIVREVQYSPTFSKPFIEIYEIDLSSFTFEVDTFTSNEHIFYNIEEYWMKEQHYIHSGCEDAPFIDDIYDFKYNFISAMQSI